MQKRFDFVFYTQQNPHFLRLCTRNSIDFVCTRPNQRVYVQVAWLIDSDTTFKREFGALQAIGDAYPKYVISATPMLRSANHEGITHIHLRKFLTDGF